MALSCNKNQKRFILLMAEQGTRDLSAQSKAAVWW